MSQDTQVPSVADANEIVDAITQKVADRFATFGGKRGPVDNPIAAAFNDGELMFALGVNVRDVVLFALVEWVVARAHMAPLTEPVSDRTTPNTDGAIS